MVSIKPISSIVKFPSAVTDAMASVAPNITVSSKRLNKVIDYVGKEFSSPENRLILGVSALMTQPFIDACNKKVDEETRKVSVARTVAKIIAGTATGYFVRLGCIKAIDAFTKLPTEINANTKLKKFRMLFTPDKAIAGGLKDLGHYKNALGTTLSLFVMLFTNFLIDAPLTKFLTNVFTAKIKEHDKIKKEKAHE